MHAFSSNQKPKDGVGEEAKDGVGEEARVGCCAAVGRRGRRAARAGARLAFGGQPLEGHSIPDCYGAMQPSAVFVPLAQLLQPEHFAVATTELFGPFQVRRAASPGGETSVRAARDTRRLGCRCVAAAAHCGSGVSRAPAGRVCSAPAAPDCSQSATSGHAAARACTCVLPKQLHALGWAAWHACLSALAPLRSLEEGVQSCSGAAPVMGAAYSGRSASVAPPLTLVALRASARTARARTASAT